VLVLGRLEDRLSRAKAIAERQVAGRSAARTARAHREELRRVVQSQLLRYLVAVGVGGRPGSAGAIPAGGPWWAAG
jgi:hypothetical protein